MFSENMKTDLGQPSRVFMDFYKFCWLQGDNIQKHLERAAALLDLRGWHPHTFKYTPGLSGANGTAVSLLLSSNNWLPVSMTSTHEDSKSGRRMSYISPATVTVMVPPGHLQYTFQLTNTSSFRGKPERQEVYALDQHTESAKHVQRPLLKNKFNKSHSNAGELSELESCNSSLESWSETSNISLDDSTSSGSSLSLSDDEPLSDSDDRSTLKVINFVNFVCIQKRASLVPEDDRVQHERHGSRVDHDDGMIRDALGNTVWSRKRSIFKTFRQESVMSLTSEFSVHWNLVRIRRLVKNLQMLPPFGRL